MKLYRIHVFFKKKLHHKYTCDGAFALKNSLKYIDPKDLASKDIVILLSLCTSSKCKPVQQGWRSLKML